MTFVPERIIGSGPGLSSDVDTLGLTIQDNVIMDWRWGLVETSSTTPTAIISYTIPASITTDCALAFEYLYGTVGIDLATDNCYYAWNGATQRRTAGTLSVANAAGGNQITQNTAGTIASLGTMTFADVGGVITMRVTAPNANRQQWWTLVRIIGVYE